MKGLRARYPVPMAEIVGLETDQLVVRTDAKSNVEDAKCNLMKVGRTIRSKELEEELLAVMSHWCGWSATTTEHCDD